MIFKSIQADTMTKIAIIRCEKNEKTCPLTSCFKAMDETTQGFSKYENCTLTGVFTCRNPGETIADLAKILKSKGAEAIHFTTCTFAKKTEKGWDHEPGGFCPQIGSMAERVSQATGLPCVLGTAHLPIGYEPVVYKKATV